MITFRIVAFTDDEPNSIAYKKFSNIEKAVEFYKKMLQNEYVNTISTRKIIEKEEEG